jgi:hypothetical protein
VSRLSPRTAWLRVVKDARCPESARVKALRALNPPAGKALLRRLLSDKDCPPRLRVIATEIYAEAMERQKQPKKPHGWKELLG